MKSFCTCCALVGLALMACGDSDSGSGSAAPTVDSGVAPTKMASETTAAEALTLCQAFADGFNSLPDNSTVLSGGCAIDTLVETFDSGAMSIDASSCSASVSSCVASGTSATLSGEDGLFAEGEGPDCGSAQEIQRDLSTCSATVGQVESCLNAMLEGFTQMFAGMNCDAFTANDFDPGSLESQFEHNPIQQPPAACDTVLAACPDLFGD